CDAIQRKGCLSCYGTPWPDVERGRTDRDCERRHFDGIFTARYRSPQFVAARIDSVEGLKTYNSEFAQTRELTFALLCQPEDVDKLEEFAPKFVEKLRAQPWCVRVLAGSRMKTLDGVHDLQRIALPLLLNLEPEAFDRAISLLQPQKTQERLAIFRRASS